MAPLSFIHCFEPGANSGALPLLLLHGTGGNEHDLLPLGQAIARGMTLLPPRGKVVEHGMPRFFRRFAEGLFDEEDVRRRAHELADFVEEARKEYGIVAPIALGFSNGANIAAAVMMLRPEVLAGGILLRAMVPLAPASAPAALCGKGVLIVSGLRDPIAPPEHAARLKNLLEAAGAEVLHRSVPAGHELTQSDVMLARPGMAEGEGYFASRSSLSTVVRGLVPRMKCWIDSPRTLKFMLNPGPHPSSNARPRA